MFNPEDVPNQKFLNKKEKDTINGVISGSLDPSKASIQKILSRPHVAVTFEAILDEAGLNETCLAKKIGEIVDRKPTRSTDTRSGKVSTNQPAIDSNVLAAIKMIWQAQGRFIERTEVHHSGSIQKMDDSQLDNIIDQGNSFLKNRIKGYTDDKD